MIDMYINNSRKQKILTPGFQKFEDQLLSQMLKIQEKQDLSKDEEKSTRAKGGYFKNKD